MFSQPTPQQLIGPVAPAGVPELRAVAVTTLFGAFTRNGTSGELGDETDTSLLLALREWADCILVGAQTVRRENYTAPTQQFAVVSRSLEFDPASDFFAGTPVLILAPRESLESSSHAARRAALVNAGARLIDIGAGSAHEILSALHSLELARISCEGGPRLYALMLAAGVVDVLHVSVDASISNADSDYGLALASTGNSFTHRFVLDAVHASSDSMLFTRYRKG